MKFYKKPKIYKNYIEDWDSSEQIIVCSNGVFKRVRVNSICYVVKRTSFDLLGLNPSDIVFDYEGDSEIFLEEKPYMKKLIPHDLIDTILKFYQVYAKDTMEVKINVWYDKVSGEFFLDCPFQDNSSYSVTEFDFDHPDIKWTESLINTFPEKFNLRTRRKNREIEKVLETHSHHTLSISFSGQDDKIDYYESVGYHLVGVYSSVLSYPILYLRYFVSPYSVGRPLNPATKDEDEVLFVESNIVDYNCDKKYSYDFNMFSNHVGITENILF